VFDVDLAVLTPTAVDVRRSGALAALNVARLAVALFRHRIVERLKVARRVDGRTVGDTLTLVGTEPLADIAESIVI